MYRTFNFCSVVHYFSGVQQLCFDRFNNFSGLAIEYCVERWRAYSENQSSKKTNKSEHFSLRNSLFQPA